MHRTITSHLWVDFMNGNLLQKVRQLGFTLLYTLCFGKANVIFTQWKPLGFDCLSLAHFALSAAFISGQTIR